MDKLTNYPNLIKRILSEYVELSNRQPQPGIETILIMDEARGITCGSSSDGKTVSAPNT